MRTSLHKSSTVAEKIGLKVFYGFILKVKKSRRELYILNRLSYKLDFYIFENGMIVATFYVKINFLSDHYLNSGVLGAYDRVGAKIGVYECKN